MSFTRDWDNTKPLDHTKFNEIAGQSRNIRDDLEDRLASIISGFTAGETTTGLKLAKFITVGTGDASTPTGTSSAATIDMYAKTVGTGQEVCLVNFNGTVLQMTTQGGAGLNAVQLSGNQTVGGIKTMASHIVAPDTNPAAAGGLQYAPKGYVDKVDATKAALGANSDITSLAGLTTALSIAQGGTGLTTKHMVIGGYTGNGGASIVVTHGLGTTPTLICVFTSDAVTIANGSKLFIWNTGQTYLMGVRGQAGDYFDVSVSSTTFTVTSSDARINGNGSSYFFLAMITQ